jgi:hypothetical protein
MLMAYSKYYKEYKYYMFRPSSQKLIPSFFLRSSTFLKFGLTLTQGSLSLPISGGMRYLFHSVVLFSITSVINAFPKDLSNSTILKRDVPCDPVDIYTTEVISWSR